MRRLVIALVVLGLLVSLLAVPAVASGTYSGGNINCGSGGYPVTHTPIWRG
jgi:hypothetical protein